MTKSMVIKTTLGVSLLLSAATGITLLIVFPPSSVIWILGLSILCLAVTSMAIAFLAKCIHYFTKRPLQSAPKDEETIGSSHPKESFSHIPQKLNIFHSNPKNSKAVVVHPFYPFIPQRDPKYFVTPLYRNVFFVKNVLEKVNPISFFKNLFQENDIANFHSVFEHPYLTEYISFQQRKQLFWEAMVARTPVPLYEVLGVMNTASNEHIRRATKKLLRELHPDYKQQGRTFTKGQHAECHLQRFLVIQSQMALLECKIDVEEVKKMVPKLGPNFNFKYETELQPKLVENKKRRERYEDKLQGTIKRRQEAIKEKRAEEEDKKSDQESNKRFEQVYKHVLETGTDIDIRNIKKFKKLLVKLEKTKGNPEKHEKIDKEIDALLDEVDNLKKSEQSQNNNNTEDKPRVSFEISRDSSKSP